MVRCSLCVCVCVFSWTCVGFVCDVLCGGAYVVLYVLFVSYCVVMYGLVLCVLCRCVSVPCLKHVCCL